jgi:hypothetical protein
MHCLVTPNFSLVCSAGRGRFPGACFEDNLEKKLELIIVSSQGSKRSRPIDFIFVELILETLMDFSLKS